MRTERSAGFFDSSAARWANHSLLCCAVAPSSHFTAVARAILALYQLSATMAHARHQAVERGADAVDHERVLDARELLDSGEVRADHLAGEHRALSKTACSIPAP